MLIRPILLMAALAAAPGFAQAETAPFDAALEAVQTKVPPPARPNDGCYYGTKCTQSPRYGRICWRVACPTNPLIRMR